jgi:hypothetical protein
MSSGRSTRYTSSARSQASWSLRRPVSGPVLVEVALFGYFATRLIKPAGLAAIRHT